MSSARHRAERSGYIQAAPCAWHYNAQQMEETNPVVLLIGDTWHIVEHSRRSKVALCGQRVSDGRAHARLKQVGVENICRDCAKLWRGGLEQR